MFFGKRLATWAGFLLRPRGNPATNRRTILCLEVLEDRAVPSASVGVNFTGNTLTDVRNLLLHSLAPPDSDGSVGPGHYAEFTNGTFAVHNKTDGSLAAAKVSDTTFWANAGIGSMLLGPGLSDPRIIFDHGSQRWFAIEITTPSTGNSVLVARSNTANPLEGFKATSFVADSGFADFPTLGVNADSLVIGTNNFTSSTGFFKNTSLFNVPKSGLLQDLPSVAGRSTFAGLTNYGFTLQAATDFGPSAGYATVLSTNSTFGSSSTINAFGVNNPAGGATLSGNTGLAVTAYSDPPNAAQPGTTITLDTNDRRINSSPFKVGDAIYEVHATTVSGRAALAWDKISASTRTLLQQGTIADPNYDYYFGSVAANANGDVVIGYTRSSSSEYASAYASVGSTSGGTLSFTDKPILLKQGTDSYSLFGSPERWGDYSTTSLDPSDTNSFWTVQEFATTDVNGGRIWATQVSQIIVSASRPPTGVGSASPASVSPGDATLLTVAVTPGSNPASTGLKVNANLSSMGGLATQTFYDDGSNGDAVAGDNVFSFQAIVGAGTAGGVKALPFTVADAQGRSSSGAISLTVNAPSPVRNIEDFDSQQNYKVVFTGGSFVRSAAASQTGVGGDLGLINHPGGSWIYRNDAGAQVGRGDTITAWVQFHNAVDGRAYFAFGASSLATYSLVLVPGAGSNQLLLQHNSFQFQLSSTIGSHTASGALLANRWYRLEVAWGPSGLITGRVFDGSSSTPLNTVSAQDSTIIGISGGIGFHATGTNDKYWDSVSAVGNLKVAGLLPGVGDRLVDGRGDRRDVLDAVFAGEGGRAAAALPLPPDLESLAPAPKVRGETRWFTSGTRGTSAGGTKVSAKDSLPGGAAAQEAILDGIFAEEEMAAD